MPRRSGSLTQSRDLRSGTPVWLARGMKRIGRDAWAKGLKPDAVVVGSGISGALMADALQQQGLDVLVLDKRKPMTGSTPASTCLLQSELDTPLVELNRKIGRQAAARAWIRSAGAVQALKARIADLELDCDFRDRSSIYLPGNLLDADGLMKEQEARAGLGLRSRLMRPQEIRQKLGFAKRAALITSGNAEADPLKLLAGFWRHFQRAGGRLVSGFEVAHADETKTRVKITSADGRTVIARHAVFCTGYELLEAYKPKGFKVVSTWAFATRRQLPKLWQGRELLWEAADPYLYMRTTTDGRVIAGGADEDFADEARRDALIERKSMEIAKLAQRYFPAIDFSPRFAWTGNFGESPTGLPAIGLLAGHRRTYQVLGFGGNGITFSMLAAQIVARGIFAIADPDAEVFAP